MKRTKSAFAVLGTSCILGVVGLVPSADACSQYLMGTLTTSAVPCETLCTAGPLTGGLAGTFEFTMDEMVDTEVPNVVRYTGMNTITTDKGILVGPNWGYWNLETGDCIDYTDIESGTGAYANASGKVTIFGRYDPATGLGQNHYVAVVKVP